jgi:hypothetical protein
MTARDKKLVSFNKDLKAYIASKVLTDPDLDPALIVPVLLHVMLRIMQETVRDKSKALQWISDAINAWPEWRE